MPAGGTHSGRVLAVAASRAPVGVDVEIERARPAALRWLARVGGLDSATLADWCATEAWLKAAGLASRRPAVGDLLLTTLGPPPAPGAQSVGTVRSPDGRSGGVSVRAALGGYLAVAVVDALLEAAAGRR